MCIRDRSGSFNVPASASFSADFNTAPTTFTGGTTTFVGSNSIHLSGAGTALTVASGETWTGSVTILGPAGLVNNGIITNSSGTNYFYGGGVDGFSFINSGTVTSLAGLLTLGDSGTDTVTNQPSGTMDANGGSITFGTSSAAITNLAGNTLTGGTWEAANGGTLSFAGTTNAVVTNDATIILSGAGSAIRTFTGVGPSYQSIEQTLVTNNGTLEVLNNRDFPATNGIVNNGTIQLGGGTLTAPSLTNNTGSVLSGNGTFGPTGGVSVGNGVLVSPGVASANNYVNAISFSTPGTLGPGGTYTFDVMNASGTAGTGYDTINVTGSLTITATPGTPFTINIESINPGTGTPGMANFNDTLPYTCLLYTSRAGERELHGGF